MRGFMNSYDNPLDLHAMTVMEPVKKMEVLSIG